VAVERNLSVYRWFWNVLVVVYPTGPVMIIKTRSGLKKLFHTLMVRKWVRHPQLLRTVWWW